jgi:two-component system, cell cycle sensor histidine kinase and response regulator CckA
MRIAQQYERPIDLLLTDVIMPGMNGTTLAKKLGATRPETKVLYMSGYTGFRDQTCFNSDAIALAKPFTREALLLKIREVLRMETASVGA